MATYFSPYSMAHRFFLSMLSPSARIAWRNGWESSRLRCAICPIPFSDSLPRPYPVKRRFPVCASFISRARRWRRWISICTKINFLVKLNSKCPWVLRKPPAFARPSLIATFPSRSKAARSVILVATRRCYYSMRMVRWYYPARLARLP